MEMKKVMDNGKVTLAVTGRLDTQTAPLLEAEMNQVLQGCTDLTFDMAELDYISSAGLRVLLKAQKAMKAQGNMKLVHVNETIMEVFDITGFLDILTVE